MFSNVFYLANITRQEMFIKVLIWGFIISCFNFKVAKMKIVKPAQIKVLSTQNDFISLFNNLNYELCCLKRGKVR